MHSLDDGGRGRSVAGPKHDSRVEPKWEKKSKPKTSGLNNTLAPRIRRCNCIVSNLHDRMACRSNIADWQKGATRADLKGRLVDGVYLLK